jgi:UDP-N-acetylglucosamine 2-epimerase
MFVCHPRTKIKLQEMGITNQLGNIQFLDALSYKQMLAAIKACSFILTDSGGLQREAYYLKKRCLIRRNSLGWSIYIDKNIHRLIGSDKEDLIRGLDWAESSIGSVFPSIDEEFIRKDSWNFAFTQLIALTQ